ncbi:MAG: glycosyltransferase, partial [Lentisphaerae bacterium]|nr:glycosyltransferase [Lentisphaerota bacterium]
MQQISIIIPVYNEQDNVDQLCAQLKQALDRLELPWEIIMVDDGSTDDTWPRLKVKAAQIPHLRLIRFRRNFGQTAAMAAGIHHARGDIIITMDADLQNDPA